MPDPLLLQVADALIAKSAAAGFARTGLLTDKGRMWEQESEPPAAYLGIAGDGSEDSPTRSVSPTATFFFYCVTKGDTPVRSFLPLYKALKDAIDNDRTLGGLCQNARVTELSVLNTSALVAGRTCVADVFVEVLYRHARGAA